MPTTPRSTLPRLTRPDPSAPFFASRGDHELRVTFGELPPPFRAGWWIHTLDLDGVRAFPPICPGGPLCTSEHTALVADHGSQAQLAVVRETPDRLELVIAGALLGSPECGVYGYYVVRLDPTGVRVGPPARGCFAAAHDGGLFVAAGPPLHLRAAAPCRAFDLELDEGTLGWTETVVETCPP